MHPEPRLEQWEKRTEWPLAAVAVAFLVVYSIQVLAQPRAPLSHALTVLMTLLYLAFVVDYVARLTLAEHRVRWFFRHLLDLAIVVLPFLRPLRLLSLVRLFTAVQRAMGGAIRGRVVMYTTCSAVLLVYVASLAVLQAERSAADANITSLVNALWWSVATVTTVGYGDLSPVTAEGRGIAVLLMIGGISLLGVVTATVASWIVQRVAEEDETNQAATAAQINELHAEIRQLRRALGDDVEDTGRLNHRHEAAGATRRR